MPRKRNSKARQSEESKATDSERDPLALEDEVNKENGCIPTPVNTIKRTY